MSERLPVIYIAGPYRAPTPWQILQNIRAAQTVALRIWKLGAVALCPHANTALFDHEAIDAIWLDGDLELIRRCDAVLMTANWRVSQGATAEHDFAEQLGMPIFFTIDLDAPSRLLQEWIHGWKESRRAEPERRYAASRDIESDFD
jgi:hypothetical protein